MTIPSYFARELSQILTQHGTSLEDLTRQPISIHRMVVRRLRQSLDGTSTSFPTLNPRDLHRVAEHFGLQQDELARLQAAMLTSAIGIKLLDRIPDERVIEVTESVFGILVNALMLTKELSLVIENGVDPMSDVTFEATFASIATAYDQAVLTMHLCYDFGSDTERAANAYQAYYQFRRIMRELRTYPADLRQNEAWHFWHLYAEEGLTDARDFLESMAIEVDDDQTAM